MRQHWAFQGRMRSDLQHGGVECYVWFWHPIEGEYPEAEQWYHEQWHHFVHWVPVAEFWPVGGNQ